MGRSGSGKTTLLQILGGRITNEVSGHVSIFGEPYRKTMRSMISYVWQDDLFFPSTTFTVRDQLMFEAFVKLPPSVSHSEIKALVNGMMAEMQIDHRADISLQLISGGERRRTSVAKELLSDPKVLLIDEGTSGLDSAAAYDLLLRLKTIAQVKNIPIVAVIHQPSTRSFYLFDVVLVLSEGSCVYRGPPTDCMTYLSKTGFDSPALQCNPADYILDLLFSQEVHDPVHGMWPRYVLQAAWQRCEAELCQASDTSDTVQVREDRTDTAPREENGGPSLALSGPTIASINDNDEPSIVPMDIESGPSFTSADCDKDHQPTKVPPTTHTSYQSSYPRQVYAVLTRSFKANYRTEFGSVNVLQAVFMAVLVGLCWFQTPHTESKVLDLSGYVLFTIAYWFFSGM